MSLLEPILSSFNSHPRDALIKFYSKGHKYEILSDPKQKYTSVTTWCHSHFPKFDADAIIKNIMKGKNWNPDNKYWGMTAEQIKESWNTNRDTQANAGTNLHEKIEKFMNDNRFQFKYTHKELYEIYISDKKNEQEEGKEWKFFTDFVKDHPNLQPFRTEWMIFDEDVKLAGSIDMVYENPDGTLSIYDWKRCKEIIKVNNWNQFAIHPLISHMHSTNFWQYALQLNTYKKIIEDKYGKKVTKLCLVRIHPDNSEETYELIDVPDLSDDISSLFEEIKSKKT